MTVRIESHRDKPIMWRNTDGTWTAAVHVRGDRIEATGNTIRETLDKLAARLERQEKT